METVRLTKEAHDELQRLAEIARRRRLFQHNVMMAALAYTPEARREQKERAIKECAHGLAQQIIEAGYGVITEREDHMVPGLTISVALMAIAPKE